MEFSFLFHFLFRLWFCSRAFGTRVCVCAWFRWLLICAVCHYANLYNCFFCERLYDMLSLQLYEYKKKRQKKIARVKKRRSGTSKMKIESQQKKTRHVEIKIITLKKKRNEIMRTNERERERLSKVEKNIVRGSVCIALPQCAVLITFRKIFLIFFLLLFRSSQL